MDEWINKMWSIHTVEYYTVLKMNEVLNHTTAQTNFEDMMLRERSQAQ